MRLVAISTCSGGGRGGGGGARVPRGCFQARTHCPQVPANVQDAPRAPALAIRGPPCPCPCHLSPCVTHLDLVGGLKPIQLVEQLQGSGGGGGWGAAAECQALSAVGRSSSTRLGLRQPATQQRSTAQHSTGRSSTWHPPRLRSHGAAHRVPTSSMVRCTSLSPPPPLLSVRAEPMLSTSSIKMMEGACSLRVAGGGG